MQNVNKPLIGVAALTFTRYRRAAKRLAAIERL